MTLKVTRLRDGVWSSKAQPHGLASGSSLGTLAAVTCSEAIHSDVKVQPTASMSGSRPGLHPPQLMRDPQGTALEKLASAYLLGTSLS